jgi:hypothetical protein
VDHAEAGAVAEGPECAFEFADEADGAEGGDAAAEFQCDVAGMSRAEGVSASMLVARVWAGFAPGAGTTAAPGPRRAEVERELAVASQHEMHRVTDA